jgi:uncharacterized protein (TIGR02147 family)
MSSDVRPQEIVRSILRDRLALLQAANARYSLRAFSKRLNVQPSTLSEILNEKREITYGLSRRVLERLSIPPREIEDILQAMPRRAPHKSRAPELVSYRVLGTEEFNVVADWYYFAILSLVETRGFVSSHAWIARRLGIAVHQSRKAVRTLIRLGLLKELRSGRWVGTGRKFRTSYDVPSSAIRKNHSQGLGLAQGALDEVPVERREFGASTIAADPRRIPAAKERIRAFRRELSAFLEGGRKSEVYRLGVQLFPLTQEMKR